ncbi:hypothetical protein DXB44_06195 [Faecalibacterium sp. OM04-11BH]|nr:hypothetical protein DXB44_06195 [Faecalibacterium sp. OM04-11BH]
MNARRCALRIFRGIGFLFGIQKSLRAFLNPFFTGGVVTENGSCTPPIKIQSRAVCGLSDFFVFTEGDTP